MNIMNIKKHLLINPLYNKLII